MFRDSDYKNYVISIGLKDELKHRAITCTRPYSIIISKGRRDFGVIIIKKT